MNIIPTFYQNHASIPQNIALQERIGENLAIRMHYPFGSPLNPKITCSSYTTLPSELYQEIAPTPVEKPRVVKFNHDLATSLGIESVLSEEAISMYAGNLVPSPLKSIALAYAGHQFGHYVPLLGDGRAVLLGEIQDIANNRWDMQLKGSGRTRFSRTGDGRCPLSAALREYIISEAMHGLGIATTRSLAIITSEDRIYRQNGLVPIGVLTRMAKGYLRVGSFQYAAHQENSNLLKYLANYALERHFPYLLNRTTPYLELFKAVVDSQASLIADWMGVGFIHGVMNTDNMAISGETIDYGPCAFMDEFNEHCVFSSIDLSGRYAFNNQVPSAHWNLARFGDALQPLVSAPEQLKEILDTFPARFNYFWSKKIRDKLGLLEKNQETATLIERFIVLMQQHQPDFTNTFRQLAKAIDSEAHQDLLLTMLGNQPQSKQWITDWLFCITHQNIDINKIKTNMNQVNPAYIPRNHLVEKAIQGCIENDDHSFIDSLLTVICRPYHQQENKDDLQCPPLPHERIHQTFCGT